jgi:malate dehydrogenase (oxaloacetate-decarboxylating)
VQKRDLKNWDTDNEVSLLDVVRNVKPDILIGVSGKPVSSPKRLFARCTSTARAHRDAAVQPDLRVEATPQDIIAWTEGNALVATGSPFDPVVWKDKTYPIAQCNNSYIFPGIGLGVIASGASRITDEMLMSASETWRSTRRWSTTVKVWLPELKDIHKVSRYRSRSRPG